MKKLLLICIMLSAQNAVANNHGSNLSDVCAKFPRHPICENCLGGGTSNDGGRRSKNSCSIFSMELGNNSSINGLISNLHADESVENMIEEINSDLLENEAVELDDLFLDAIEDYDGVTSSNFKSEALRVSELQNGFRKFSSYFKMLGIRDSQRIVSLVKGDHAESTIIEKVLKEKANFNTLQAKKFVNSLKLLLKR